MSRWLFNEFGNDGGDEKNDAPEMTPNSQKKKKKTAKKRQIPRNLPPKTDPAVSTSEPSSAPPEPASPVKRTISSPESGLASELSPETPSESKLDAPWSVSRLTERIRETLETNFARVTVVGEISDLACPGSGHVYFTLRDSKAQIPGVIWRGVAQRFPFELSDGLSVICHGRIEIYPARGRYQLIIDSLRPEGLGPLELAFRQLHARLTREGLFDPGRKQPIPRGVRRIAVVTSPTGAAIHDFLNVLRRRRRHDLEITILPVRVQGTGAAEEIAAAVDRANLVRTPPFDVIVVTRGGGSLEDLWAFNEECVVRAIVRSRIPVISGVGHEVDTTLADLAADLRALTPSEAAQRVAPSADEIEQILRQLGPRLGGALQRRIQLLQRQFDDLCRRRCFADPLRRLRDEERKLDDLDERLQRAIERKNHAAQRELAMTAERLDAVSPLAVLKRGCSITLSPDGRRLRSVTDVAVGSMIVTHLMDGTIESRIEKIAENSGAEW